MNVLISIQPKWVEKIVNGEKTIEVRKSRPKLETPFKCFIYCARGKHFFFKEQIGLGAFTGYHKVPNVLTILNQKVIGEFICDGIQEWKYKQNPYRDDEKYKIYHISCADGEATCLDYDDIELYGKGKPLYGWHISDLKIYDTPKELSEFCKPFKYDGDGLICGTREEMNDIYEFDCETVFGKIYPDFSLKDFDCKHCPKAKDFYMLKRPPQSWCYVEEL